MDGCDKCGEWERGAGEVGEEEMCRVGSESLAEHLTHKPLQISEVYTVWFTNMFSTNFIHTTVVKRPVG